MGTSVSHPSPQTPKWKKVSQVYWDQKVKEQELVKRLAETVRFKDLPEFASPGVVSVVDALIRAMQSTPADSARDLNDLTGHVNRLSQEARSSPQFRNSLATELALRAAHRTLASHLMKPASESLTAPPEVMRAFLGRYLGEVFNHYTARDTGAALGNGKIGNTGQLESILLPVSRRCEQDSEHPVVAGRLQRHLNNYQGLPDQFRQVRLGRALRDGMRETLRRLKTEEAA